MLRRHLIIGAAGVVGSTTAYFLTNTTPSAPPTVASQHSIDGAASPPRLRRGILLSRDTCLDKEAFKGLDHSLRCFLGQIVSGIERTAGHVGCGFAPDREQVASVKHSCVAPAPPHNQHGCGDLASSLVIRFVMREIDSRGRAIVLA